MNFASLGIRSFELVSFWAKSDLSQTYQFVSRIDVLNQFEIEPYEICPIQ